MQMCPADAEAGCGLLDIFADLWEPLPVESGLLLVVRANVVIPPIRLLRWEKMFRKLHIHVVAAKETGWPQGPNVTARAAWRTFIELGEYEALWLMEPDSVPVKPDFHWRTTSEWFLRPAGRHVLGFWVQSPAADRGHYNGNMIIARDFAGVCPDFLNAPELSQHPWDIWHRTALVRHGTPSREIASVHNWGAPGSKKLWTDPNMIFLPLELPRHHPLGPLMHPSWLHGVKRTAEAQAAVRARLLPRAVNPAMA